MLPRLMLYKESTGWLIDYDIVVDVGGLRFDYQASQIGLTFHRLITAAAFLRSSELCCWGLSRENELRHS